jgi:hypothetical protein
MVALGTDRLEGGRAALRESQRAWAGLPPASYSRAPLDAALARVRAEEDAMISEGEWLREGVFRYPVETERRRWARTRDILERIQPGPHEDENYVAMLAHQAAAIELTIESWSGFADRNPDLCSRILVGTTVAPRSQGSARLVGDGVVIEMSAGMIDLLYQSAKAIVLSWKRTDSNEADRPLSFSTSVDDVEEVLNATPYPMELLFDTLAAWLYEGRYRADHSHAPPPEYHPPLKLLINGAERFVLAHEYAHAIFDQLLAMPGDDATSWDRELRADTFATTVVARSSREFDCLPATIALQGAVVAMRAHDLLDAAVQMARIGRETGSSASDSHPSFEFRREVLEQAFVKMSDDADEAREQLPGLQKPSITLAQLWDRVAPLLQAQFRAGRGLHPIWSA